MTLDAQARLKLTLGEQFWQLQHLQDEVAACRAQILTLRAELAARDKAIADLIACGAGRSEDESACEAGRDLPPRAGRD